MSVTNEKPRSAEDVALKGLSTDQKPLNVPINTLMLELDTGDFYYFTGVTWAKVGG